MHFDLHSIKSSNFFIISYERFLQRQFVKHIIHQLKFLHFFLISFHAFAAVRWMMSMLLLLLLLTTMPHYHYYRFVNTHTHRHPNVTMIRRFGQHSDARTSRHSLNDPTCATLCAPLL